MNFLFTPMVRNLLLINVAVFLATDILHMDLMMFALRNFKSDQFHPVQLLTHMFMHAGFFHLFGNMFSLIMFGSALEGFWGSKRMLIFYLLCGIGAGIIYSAVRYYDISKLESIKNAFKEDPSVELIYAFEKESGIRFKEEYKTELENNPHDMQLAEIWHTALENELLDIINAPMLGASGAVFGILFAFGYLFPNTELIFLLFPIPIKAKYFVFLYGLAELYFGIKQVPGDNIAHFAHLGGMLIGYVIIRYWKYKRNIFY
ncbi:MAG: rhomboid family intramembrane serine protease [Cytophagaceae bacterium]|nr:rhomboid family intramembrane serine protease [Cytophagaceae bacterium]MDW8456278.1 rhomboid family intramembrane serine protease [Cytophagaceae bacterium]